MRYAWTLTIYQATSSLSAHHAKRRGNTLTSVEHLMPTCAVFVVPGGFDIQSESLLSLMYASTLATFIYEVRFLTIAQHEAVEGNVIADLHEFCMSEAAQAQAKFVAAAACGWTLPRVVLDCRVKEHILIRRECRDFVQTSKFFLFFPK